MASSAPLYTYDVFISYSHADRSWVQTWLLPQIEAAGLRACIDDRDFAIGTPSLVNMEAAVMESRHTLIVLTPAWVNSEWSAFEALLTQTTDPAGRQQRLLPLLLELCQPPLRIASLSYIDFTAPQQHIRQLRRLIDTLQGRARPADLGQTLQHLLPDRLLTQDERKRRAMLRKVRTIWIDGLLKHSLYNETLIALGLYTRPDAVVRPLDVLVHLPNQATTPLPPDKRIGEVFDECAGALLILGAPGAGKTTLLLELARDLLDRAEQDAIYPIPVVFPLSSWAERRLSLIEWLVDELNKRYDVPRKIAQSWVAADHILPLLDGLDEVKPDVRGACVDAINMYRQEHGLLPLVVSSRIVDYDALAIKLRLHGAIVVQPLTRAQVKNYLRQIGIGISPSSTSPLWNLLDTPLMLNIATLAYIDQPEAPLQTSGTLEQRRDQIFAFYVDRMFQRHSAHLRFSQHQTVRWLSWLAWQMQRRNQSVFYMEHLQPDWLPSHQSWIPTKGLAVVIGLTGFLSATIGGLFFWWAGYSKQIELVESTRWSWVNIRDSWHQIVVNASVSLLLILVALLITEVLNEPSVDWPLTFGLALTLGLGTCLYLTIRKGLSRIEIQTRTLPNQGIHRSLRNAVIVSLLYSAVIGLCLSPIVAIAFLSYQSESPSILLVLATLLVSMLWFMWNSGPLLALNYGGRTFLQHCVLRLLLTRNGFAPWYYVQFLDHTTRLILLRKVGGGYIFIHRLLLDYFAKQYTGPETIEMNIANESK